MDKANIISTLGNILHELIEKENFIQSIKLLEKLRVDKLINYLVNVLNEYDDNDKLIVQLLIRILQNICNNGDEISPVTDEDYDKLYALNLQLTDEDIVGAPINKSNKIISNHKYTDLRGTLDKFHFVTIKDRGKDKRKSIEDKINSIENKLGRKLTEDESKVHMFPKWDGVSGIFECDETGETEKALSRGDTNINEAVDWTKLFKGTNFGYIRSHMNNKHEFGVKTEIVMSQDNYKLLCKKDGRFKNTRSAVTSIVNSLDGIKEYISYLTIIPLQVQDFENKDIFIPSQVYDFPYMVNYLNNLDEIDWYISQLRKKVADEVGIDIDGIVFRFVDKGIQKLLGREGAINKYEFAYKFPPDQKKTIIKDVKFSVGLLGSITPVAIIKPVVIKGNTITNISLGSIDRFEELGLHANDEVIIKYDIIPYLTIDNTCKKGNGKKFITPTICEYCNKELVKEPVLKCINEECDCRIIGKIINYTTKMNIPNMDVGVVGTLFQNGLLMSIGDLYTLNRKRNGIVAIDGFGQKSFNNIIEGINSRREVYDYELLGSIGIPDIGRKIFKKILNIYYISELIDLCLENKIERLLLIKGIKDKTANKIIEGIKSNQQLIQFLRSELIIRRDERRYTIKVCFTKVRDRNFEKFLDDKNILVLESYSKEVDLLIIPSRDIDSTKVTTAKKAGKEIVTISEAYQMFGYTQQL